MKFIALGYYKIKMHEDSYINRIHSEEIRQLHIWKKTTLQKGLQMTSQHYIGL